MVPSSRPRGGLLVRGVAVAGTAALAVVAAVQYGASAADRESIRALVAKTGVAQRRAEIARRIVREPDPTLARVALARAMVSESLDPRAYDELPPREAMEAAGRSGERLELAVQLAEEAWRERPANWQAAMLLGAARYWMWARRGDPRLLDRRSEWEGPLRAALELAPGSDEPPRLLALAFLEIWPALSAAERTEAVGLLGRAFRDPLALRLGAPRWLALAPTRAAAYAPIPDQPWAWREIGRMLADRRDWQGFCEVRERHDTAAAASLESRLELVARQLAGGDPDGGRETALGVIAEAPPGLRYADAVVAALRLAPAGVPTAGNRAAARSWLEWAIEGAVRGVSLLPADVIARLAAAAGDLPPPARALADLAAGDLARAEVLERRSEALGLEPWAPYCILKARLLAARGDLPAAGEILGRVHRSWRNSVPELQSRLAVAESAGDGAVIAAARVELEALAARSWPATAWRWRGGEASLDLVVSQTGAVVEIDADLVPDGGAVAVVTLDFEEIAVVPVKAGEPIVIERTVEAGPHRLTFVALVGGRAVPGAVTIRAAATS